MSRFCGKLAPAFTPALLFVLEALIDLLKNLVLYLACQAKLFGSLADRAGWQIQVNLVNDLAEMTLHVGNDDCLREALTIGLVPTVVLDLDVQVERALAAVDLLAVLVGADVLAIDLFCRAPVVLFALVVLAAVSAMAHRLH